MRPAGGDDPYSYLNNNAGYSNHPHHPQGQHPHPHHHSNSAHVYEAIPSRYGAVMDASMENHHPQQYHRPHQHQELYYTTSHHHAAPVHYHGGGNNATGYLVDGNYTSQHQQMSYETASMHHPQVIYTQPHHEQQYVIAGNSSATVNNEHHKVQLRQQQQNILNRLASTTSSAKSPGSSPSKASDINRSDNRLADQSWDVNLVAQEFENLQEKQRQQKLAHDRLERKAKSSEQQQYNSQAYEYNAHSKSSYGYREYSQQRQLQHTNESGTLSYEVPVNSHYAAPGSSATVYSSSTGATVYQQPHQHKNESYYTILSQDSTHGVAPASVYYSTSHLDSHSQRVLSQPQQVVVYDSYDSNAPVSSQYPYQTNAAPGIQIAYAAVAPEDDEYQYQQNAQYYDSNQQAQIAQQAQLRKQILELRAKASRGDNHDSRKYPEKHGSYMETSNRNIEIDQSYPSHSQQAATYFLALDPAPSNEHRYSKNYGLVQTYDSAGVPIHSHHQSNFVNLADYNGDNSSQGGDVDNDNNSKIFPNKSPTGGNVSNEVNTENLRACPMYTTKMLSSVVSPNTTSRKDEVDKWWPSTKKLEAEPKTRVSESFLTQKTSPADESVALRLQKMPHCKVHNLVLRENGGVLFKKEENNTPMFCWQVTELYPTEPMVSCSKCHTWRHACCGGHHDFKGYDTIPTDMPSEFEAVCDMCHEETDIENRLSSDALKNLKELRINHLKRICIANEIARHATFHKYGGTYKWPIGSVIKTHINGHTRSIYGRQEKAAKLLRGMVTKLGNGIGSAVRTKERVKVRAKELEKLSSFFEDAEGFTDRHNMRLFLHMDTAAEHPAGYENEQNNFFDPANYPSDDENDVDGNNEETSNIDKGQDLDDKSTEITLSCAREGCIKKPRFDSIYCCDGCGVHVVQRELLRTLEYAADIHPSILK